MRKCVYDIEGNGLLTPYWDDKASILRPPCSRIWCVVICDLESGEYFKYGPDENIEAYKKLQEYDLIIAHNGMSYDTPAMEKIVGEPNGLGPLPRTGDTYIMSRLLYPPQGAPGRGHGIGPWGEYFRFPKGDFHEFHMYSDEMMKYCVRDVEINVMVYKFLLPQMKSDLAQAYECELKFADLLMSQMRAGAVLDKDEHEKLTQMLMIAKAEAMDQLRDIDPPGNTTVLKTVEYWLDPETGTKYSKKGEIVGRGSGAIKDRLEPGPFIQKVKPFNPKSPNQLADYFINVKGYKPKKMTDNGNPSFGEEVLDKMPYPEAEHILNYNVASNRLSQVESWDKFEYNGRVHGNINSLGATTYRCTHSNPNLGAIPAIYKPFGLECRRCWAAPEGMAMTGTDAKGLELRTLANGLAPFDDGAYIRRVLSGEIHNQNQELLGLPTRDEAKTIIYAFNYSAGLLKLGKLGESSDKLQDAATEVRLPAMYVKYLSEQGWDTDENKHIAKIGSVVKKLLFENISGLDKLLDYLKKQNNQYGWLLGIDGRRIHVDQEYSILNRRLQSDGGIIMKYAMINHYDLITAEGLTLDKDWFYSFNVHDEWQATHPPEYGELFRTAGNRAIEMAGEQLGLTCPLAGDSKTGKNWAETH